MKCQTIHQFHTATLTLGDDGVSEIERIPARSTQLGFGYLPWRDVIQRDREFTFNRIHFFGWIFLFDISDELAPEPQQVRVELPDAFKD